MLYPRLCRNFVGLLEFGAREQGSTQKGENGHKRKRTKEKMDKKRKTDEREDGQKEKNGRKRKRTKREERTKEKTDKREKGARDTCYDGGASFLLRDHSLEQIDLPTDL